MSRFSVLSVLLASLALTGCELFEGRGEVSLSIAATESIEDFDRVVVAISKLVFVSEDGERETVDFSSAEQLDLLEAARDGSIRLITDETIPSARYKAVEITIDSAQINSPSFINQNGSQLELFIPDDQQDELKLTVDFEVDDAETTELTLQFELRSSLRRQADGNYELHPKLRLVQDAQVGSIEGTVAAALVPASCVPAIYAYDGSNITPDDIGGSGIDPLTTATLSEASNAWTYSLDFLGEGTYVVALTCEADEDDPAVNDALEFVVEDKATVDAGETTRLDLSR